jgi:hypothetical protein
MLKQGSKTPEGPCLYEFSSSNINDLVGQVLTFIDASISDPIQRKAMKDILQPMLCKWAIDADPSTNHD